jgi:autotransporter-associated beta strand protein
VGALAAAVAATALAGHAAHAANLSWDADGISPVGGGSGAWNTTDAFWTPDNGANYQAWNNANGDTAVFGGTAGTVSLGTPISAAGLTFNTNNYVLDLNGNDLTTTSTISAPAISSITIRNTSATFATFSATSFNNSGPKFSGNLNINYNSTGTWQPALDHDYAGLLTQSTGVIRIDHDAQLGVAGTGVKMINTATFSGNTAGGLQSASISHPFEIVGSTQQFIIGGIKLFTISGAITGAGDLRLIGSQGTLVLSGNNSFTGITNLTGTSTLIAANDNALGNLGAMTISVATSLGFQGNINIGAKPLTVSGGAPASGIGTLHNFSGSNTYGGTISLGSNLPRGIGAEPNSTLTLTGVLSAGRGINKLGFGTVVLTGANTYGTSSTASQAGTYVTEGTLRLDFSAPGAPAADIINNGSTSVGSSTGASQLVLSGGTLEVKGANGATNSQRFKDNTSTGFQVTPGHSSVVITQNGAASLTLNTGRLATASRSVGGTLDFTTLPSTGGIVMPSGTSTVGANGALIAANGAAFATVGGSDWAALDAAGNRTVVAGSSIPNFYTNNSANTMTGNVDIVAQDTALDSSVSVGSIRFNEAAARTITATGQTLTTGGILVTSAVGNNAINISDGTLMGAAGKDLVVIQNNSANALNISSVIADNTSSTGLTKSGPGMVVLSGANTYSGNTNVNGGILKLDNASALGTTGGNIAMHGGILGLTNNSGDFTRAVGTGANQVQFLGSGGFAAYGNDRIVNLGGGGTVTWGGTAGGGTAGFLPTGSTLVLSANDATGMIDFKNNLRLLGGSVPSTVTRTIQVDNGQANVDAKISGNVTGEAGFIKTGAGTLELAGTNNTYIGATTIAGGTVQLTGPLVGGDGSGGNVSAFTVNPGTTLKVGIGGASGSLNGPIADNGTTIFNRTDTVTYGGIISGTGTLNFAGSGTVILTGNSTFTGSTTTSPGTVVIGNQTTIDGTTGNSGSFAGNITNNGTLVFNRFSSTTYAGAISGSGALTKNGLGTLVLSGSANTYSGVTTLNSGVVNFAGAGSMGTGNITFNGGTLRWGTGNTTDISTRTVTLTGAGTVDTNGNSVVLANSIGNGGSGALTKSGLGTLTLSGNNTYTGATTVANGTLIVSGSNTTSGTTVNGGTLIANSATASGTGNVTVNNGGTVGGLGTIGNLTVNSGGHVAPGTSPGTLTAATLTLNTGAAFDYDLANVTTLGSGVNDLLVVSGGGNPNPQGTDSFVLNINATNGSLADGVYTIIDSGSPLTLDPTKWNVGTNNASGTYQFTFSLNGGGDLVLDVQPTVVGPPDSFWTKDDSVSLWSSPGSWTAGVPNAVNAKATFGSVITADRTVTVDGQQIVGTMTFDNTNRYTLVPGQFGGLVVVDSSTSGAVNVNSGSHDIVTPIQLNKDTTFAVNPPGSTLTVSDLTATGVNVTKTGSGTLTVNRVRGNDLTISGGTLKLIPDGQISGVSKVAALSVSAAAKLDISDNKVITTSAVGTVSGVTYDGVTGLIQSGRGTGSWNGTSGIVTSQTQATTSGLTSIGIATAAQAKGMAATDTAVFAGQVVTGSDTLVMYTYGGDANLDGKINVDDYGRIDSNIGLGTAGWYNGDFNYDGKVNVDDYGVIDSNIGIQGVPFATAGGAGAAAALGVSAVPEPASIGLVALGGLALLQRRRRRRRYV